MSSKSVHRERELMSKQVVKMRKKVGMTQVEFANVTGIPLRTLQNWERGHRSPPIYLIMLLEKALKFDGVLDSR